MSPIEIGSNGDINDGNLRVRAARILTDAGSWWFREVPVIVLKQEFQLVTQPLSFATAQKARRMLEDFGIYADVRLIDKETA
jgi:hypothetical protein